MPVLIEECYNQNHDLWLEIVPPHIKKLELSWLCSEIRFTQRNVASLVTAILCLNLDVDGEERNLDKECSYLKELLQSVSHVENLELDNWCIECLSILDLKGWRCPPSSHKFLKLYAALEQLDFSGICNFLQSSSDLESLVIKCYNHGPRHLLSTYTNEDEHNRRFETHNFNCPLLHPKTIKIINFDGPLYGNKSVLPFVKYLLKIATGLEKFIIAARFGGSDVPQDYIKMAQEFPCFPRSSVHASVVFSY